jgi:XRE family transcriptional regulator, regulator of sulfur utilization
MHPLEKEKLLLTVGERIRKMRLHHDKTTKEIAAHLRITTQAYGNMERGKSDISISRLIELSKFFQVPLLTILTEDHYTAIIQFENTGFITSGQLPEKKIG